MDVVHQDQPGAGRALLPLEAKAPATAAVPPQEVGCLVDDLGVLATHFHEGALQPALPGVDGGARPAILTPTSRDPVKLTNLVVG